MAATTHLRTGLPNGTPHSARRRRIGAAAARHDAFAVALLPIGRAPFVARQAAPGRQAIPRPGERALGAVHRSRVLGQGARLCHRGCGCRWSTGARGPRIGSIVPFGEELIREQWARSAVVGRRGHRAGRRRRRARARSRVRTQRLRHAEQRLLEARPVAERRRVAATRHRLPALHGFLRLRARDERRLSAGPAGADVATSKRAPMSAITIAGDGGRGPRASAATSIPTPTVTTTTRSARASASATACSIRLRTTTSTTRAAARR